MMPLWTRAIRPDGVGVRVGVGLGRGAVRGPAGVGDADGRAVHVALESWLRAPNAADGPADVELAVSDDDHAGRVVTAVFEPLEAFEEDGASLRRPI